MSICRRHLKQPIVLLGILTSIAFLSILAYLGFFYCPSAPVAERRSECVKRLGSIYRILASSLKDTKALPEVPPVDGERPGLAPIDVDALGITSAFCPVVYHLTDGKVKSPFLLVYAIQERDSGHWKRISLYVGEPVPLAFVSESFGQGGGFHEGLICYSDGSVKSGVLPTVCPTDTILRLPPSHGTLSPDSAFWTTEIIIPEEDGRFPYRKQVAAMRVQYLSEPP